MAAHIALKDIAFGVIKWSEKMRNNQGLGGASEIAKVNVALNVIYWHITRLAPVAHV